MIKNKFNHAEGDLATYDAYYGDELLDYPNESDISYESQLNNIDIEEMPF